MGSKANRKVLRQCLEGLDVTTFTEPTELLKAVYQAAKAKILDYTLLQYAEDLGFGQSPQLRMMMSGQRSLTVKAARKVADSLWLHGSVRHYFLNLVEFTNARLPEDRERLLKAVASWKYKAAARPVDERVSRYLGHWLNPVIRELVASGHASADVEDIRSVLNFPVLPAEVRAALDLLLELKMLRYVKGGAALASTGGDVVTDAEVDALGAVVYHQAMIAVAKESITRIPPNEREITGITLVLSPELLPEVKARTQEYLDFIQSLEARSGPSRDVYQVNVQVFPFTKVKS